MTAAPALVEHFFRHEYGKLVATLCRRFGVEHVEAVEDAVQGALTRGLETWPIVGLPDDPSAWLFRPMGTSCMLRVAGIKTTREAYTK